MVRGRKTAYSKAGRSATNPQRARYRSTQRRMQRRIGDDGWGAELWL